MSLKKSIWVVITDSNTCRIYNYTYPNHLSLHKTLEHPENKLRDIELTSDKPGHYKTSGSAHGAYSQPSDPKEIKIDNFSRDIAKELEHGRTNHAYEKLVIIAPPHMTGLLAHHLNKHVKDLISHTIEKDLVHAREQEIIDFLQKHTRYSAE